MSLNPFSVRYLRPKVELMHVLRMRRHYRHVWNSKLKHTALNRLRVRLDVILLLNWGYIWKYF